jgi:CubicO group peptidase (beta-lactamase class C family)
MASSTVEGIRVEGDCADAFAPVRAALEENFASRGEIGSAVCVYHEGQKVVDIWGGHMDAARSRPWQADTLCLMYSIAKSICALSVHMLADQGKVDLDAPVATYWPEFAQAGKDEIKVRHVLAHWCGVWPNDAASPGDIYDWERMIAVIERQEPAWPVETKGAYNSVNIGFILGEIARRVTGQRVQDFVHDRICRPLGATYYLGVPESALDRCAEIVPNPADAVRAAGRNANSAAARAWRAFPKDFGTEAQNSAKFRQAGVPSFGGFGEARGMARIYAALAEGGAIDGVRLLSPGAVARAAETQWSDMEEGLLHRPLAMALGFMTNPPDGMKLFGPADDAFGHLGSGGARALAIPSKRLALCFVSNYQSEQRSIGARTEAIVEAAGACVS